MKCTLDLLMSGLSESVRRTGDTLFEARMLIVFSTWEVGIRIRKTHSSHTVLLVQEFSGHDSYLSEIKIRF